MNPRIKELMEQAKITSTAIDPFNKMPYEYTHFSEEKFAELIVKECAHLVGGYTKENEFGTDVKEAYEEITKHFGVEE